MKKFLIRVFYFMSFFLFMAFLFQLIFNYFVIGKCINGHDNFELTSNVNADLLFLGSSRCRAHFDPQFFSRETGYRCLNLGVDGHSELSMQILRLQIYLKDNIPPRLIVLSFDPLVSGGSLEGNINFIHKNDFSKYSFFPDRRILPLVDYFKFDCFEKYFPMWSVLKYHTMDEIFQNKGSVFLQYGYDFHYFRDNPYSGESDNGLTHYRLINDSNNVISKLKMLRSICNSKGICLVGIQTPVYRAIYSGVDFNVSKSIFSALDIPFVDLSNSDIGQDTKYFYNSDHMNSLGVEMMNKKLMDDTAFQKVLFNDCRHSH